MSNFHDCVTFKWMHCALYFVACIALHKHSHNNIYIHIYRLWIFFFIIVRLIRGDCAFACLWSLLAAKRFLCELLRRFAYCLQCVSWQTVMWCHHFKQQTYSILKNPSTCCYLLASYSLSVLSLSLSSSSSSSLVSFSICYSQLPINFWHCCCCCCEVFFCVLLLDFIDRFHIFLSSLVSTK